MEGAWSSASAVKSTGCSCSGSRFGSQNPHCDSQPSATPVPGDLTLPTGLGSTRYAHGKHRCTWVLAHTIGEINLFKSHTEDLTVL